jgi:multiple sugar transport system permease protein
MALTDGLTASIPIAATPGERRRVIARRVSHGAYAVLRGVIVIGICFLILHPIVSRVMISFMTEQDLFDQTVIYIPRRFTLANFATVWRAMNFAVPFFNSLRLTVLVSLLQVVSCALIGYGFARFDFPGKRIWFGLVIFTLIVPPQTVMIPLFLHFRFFDVLGMFRLVTGEQGINLLDTIWPFVLMSATGMGLKSGLYIYIVRQFYRSVPRELEEAAYIDGAGVLKTFTMVMLPSGIPAFVTVFLFSFVWQWTDTFYSNLFLRNLITLPRALSSLPLVISRQMYGEIGTLATMPPAMASMYTNVGSLMLVAPLIVLYVVFQRYFVESVERSGMVG